VVEKRSRTTGVE